MEFLRHLLSTGTSTLTDVLPIVGIIFGFQLLVLRQNIPNLKRVLVGFAYVWNRGDLNWMRAFGSPANPRNAGGAEPVRGGADHRGLRIEPNVESRDVRA